MSSNTTSQYGTDQTAISAFASFVDKYERGTGGATRGIARDLALLSPPFTSTSTILDNACGTGIVLEELQSHLTSQNISSNLHIPVTACDAAAPMIQACKSKTSTLTNLTPITTHVVTAEKLDASIVPDASISHSYTNFGIFFCTDPHAAATQIHRSLAPGGTAFVTCWNDLGWLRPTRETEKIVYPDTPEYQVPFGEAWRDPSYIKSVMVKGGFEEGNVKVVKRETMYAGKNVKDVAEGGADLFGGLAGRNEQWNNGEEGKREKKEWIETLVGVLKREKNVVKDDAEGFGIYMSANVAICTK